MTKFYTPNPTQYLNLTTTLLTINKQQIQSFQLCFHPPIFMQILEYRIKNTGWKTLRCA